MERAILLLEPPRAQTGTIELAATLSHPDGRRCRLWWRLPDQWKHALTEWADPFLVGLLFPIMQWQTDVHVEGRLSPSLLANLEEYMALWHVWFPASYRPVSVRAAQEIEPPPPPRPGLTVVPFSCGVDSCFTVRRHSLGLPGRRTRTVAAAAVMNGFDIRLDQPNAQAMYDDLLARARSILADAAVPAVPMTSNFHELPTLWKHSFATHLVSGLMLLEGAFDSALVPSCVGYEDLGRRWAAHPLADSLLAGRAFSVRDDGPECLRADKIQLLSQWPAALQHLRVCFSNPGLVDNCCRCEKCVRTILTFKAAGLPLPPAFARAPSPRDIRGARFPHRNNIVHYWQEVASSAAAHGLSGEPWARAIPAAIRRNRLRWFLGALKRPLIPLRNALRKLFRGSPASRGQLAKQAKRSQKNLRDQPS